MYPAKHLDANLLTDIPTLSNQVMLSLRVVPMLVSFVPTFESPNLVPFTFVPWTYLPTYLGRFLSDSGERMIKLICHLWEEVCVRLWRRALSCNYNVKQERERERERKNEMSVRLYLSIEVFVNEWAAPDHIDYYQQTKSVKVFSSSISLSSPPFVLMFFSLSLICDSA